MALEGLDPESEQPHQALTAREFQILGMRLRGTSVVNVAQQLILSSKTVSTRKARLMRKMNVRTNADLVRYGIQHGLIHQHGLADIEPAVP
jgi:DNA-binding NarL/FixJ family response regulator